MRTVICSPDIGLPSPQMQIYNSSMLKLRANHALQRTAVGGRGCKSLRLVAVVVNLIV